MAQHLSLSLNPVKRRQNTAMHYLFLQETIQQFYEVPAVSSLWVGSDRQVAAFAKKPEKILVFLYLLEYNKVLSH